MGLSGGPARHFSSSSSATAAPSENAAKRPQQKRAPRPKSAPPPATDGSKDKGRPPRAGKKGKGERNNSAPHGKRTDEKAVAAEKRAEAKRQAFSARSAAEARAAGHLLAGVDTVAAFRAKFEELARGGETFGLFCHDVSVPVDRLCKLLLAEGAHSLTPESEAALNRVLDALMLTLDRRRWWTVAEARARASAVSGEGSVAGDAESTASAGVTPGDLAHSFFGAAEKEAAAGAASSSSSSSSSVVNNGAGVAGHMDVSAAVAAAVDLTAIDQPPPLSAKELAASVSSTSASASGGSGAASKELPHRPHWRSMLRSTELVNLAHVLCSHKLASSEHLTLIAERLMDFGLHSNMPAAEAASFLSSVAQAQAEGVVLTPPVRKLSSALLPILSTRMSSMEAPSLCELASSLHSLRQSHASVSQQLFIQVGDLLAAKLRSSLAIKPSPSQMAGALEALGCAGIRSTRLVAASPNSRHRAFPKFQTEFWLSEGISRAAANAPDAETLCAIAHAASRFGMLAPRKLQENKPSVPASDSGPASSAGKGGKGKGPTAINMKTGKKKYEVTTRSSPIDVNDPDIDIMSKHGAAGDAVWEAVEKRASELLTTLQGKQLVSLAASFAKASRVRMLEDSNQRRVSTAAGKLVVSGAGPAAGASPAGAAVAGEEQAAATASSEATPEAEAAEAVEKPADSAAADATATAGAGPSLSPLAIGSPLFWAAMRDSLLLHMRELSVSEAALAAWSFHKLQSADEALMHALSMRVVEALHPESIEASKAAAKERRLERRKARREEASAAAAPADGSADAEKAKPSKQQNSNNNKVDESEQASSSSSFNRLGLLRRAHSHAEAACLILPALQALPSPAPAAPGSAPVSAVLRSPYAEAVSLLLSDVAKALFDAIPQHQYQQDLSGATGASNADGGGAKRAANTAAFAHQFSEACEPVADLLRMAMLSAQVINPRLPPRKPAAPAAAAGDASAAPLAEAALPHHPSFFYLPIRQLTVASALAIGAQSDDSPLLASGYSVDRLMSLLTCYSVAESRWHELSGGGPSNEDGSVASATSPEKAILSGAASRLRRVLGQKGLTLHGQVAALRGLRDVFFTPSLADMVLKPAISFKDMPLPSTNPVLAYGLAGKIVDRKKAGAHNSAMNNASASAVAAAAAMKKAKASAQLEMQGGGIK